jgi:carbamoylphosphate synthase large subunit
VLIGGIMEHIEQAGVHSGDSACSLPPYSLSREMQDELREQTAQDGAGAEGRVGLMNVQFAIQNASSTCSKSIRAPRAPCPSCPRRPACRSPRSPRAA